MLNFNVRPATLIILNENNTVFLQPFCWRL